MTRRASPCALCGACAPGKGTRQPFEQGCHAPCDATLTLATPRRKQNGFYAFVRRERLTRGGYPPQAALPRRRIKSCFVPCAPAARAIADPQAPGCRRAYAASRGGCTAPLRLLAPSPGAAAVDRAGTRLSAAADSSESRLHNEPDMLAAAWSLPPPIDKLRAGRLRTATPPGTGYTRHPARQASKLSLSRRVLALRPKRGRPSVIFAFEAGKRWGFKSKVLR